MAPVTASNEGAGVGVGVGVGVSFAVSLCRRNGFPKAEN